MSANQPIWKTTYDADPKGGPNLPDLSDIGTSHAGWYYDLPLDGERIVTDVQLRDGRLAVICFRPNPDPCSDESNSFFMELNAFTGGGPPETSFDLNEDGVIDPADTVLTEYDTDSNPVRIPPAGIEMPGNLQPPISLRLNHLVEISYLASSTGAVHLLKAPAVKQGVMYWKELER